MQRIRRSAERGHVDHGWLESFHSFSFGEYFDPRHVEFGPLRVINEDRVQPGTGFAEHGHRDMEILSYVIAGQLEHKDSLGNGSVIRPGDVQRMSAGRGVRHSEFNPSRTEPVHFLQIWIKPERAGLDPSYEQGRLDPAAKQGRLACIAAPQAGAGCVRLHQDASVYVGQFDAGQQAGLDLAPGRRAYVHVVRGTIEANACALQAGDALLLEHASALRLRHGSEAEVLVFDLPAGA